MADILDLAEEQNQKILAHELAMCKKDEPPKESTGECWFCGEEVESPKRWCCPDCRDKWELKNNK